MNSSRIVFFQVHDNSAKLKYIVDAATAHFHKKEPFIIFVEDDRAQQFVDQLLWKLPETSFLPHTSTDGPSSELVVITKMKQNCNNAKAAFNLCPTPLLIDGPFKIIYEFEDLTSISKKNFSSIRFDAYKQAGCLIEAR